MDELQTEASDRMIDDHITFAGMRSPEEVRDIMEKSHIHIFTSNYLEGWGSVIYEALNAGCATVVSHAPGAAPWLVKHEKTGLIFKSGSVESLTEQLEKLLKDPSLCDKYGIAAYKQMERLWNPQVAAKRVVEIYEAIEDGRDTPFDSCPCSAAPMIRNGWYNGV